MKKLSNILWGILSLIFVLSACAPEQDDIFDDSSANRIEAAMKSYQEILASASNGWLMEYYPNALQAYGGYNILVSFTKDGKIQASSDVYGSGKVSESSYKLYQSTGVMLSVDTYNEVFHFFSDPNNPAGIGKKGDGMEGDFEFTIMSISKEEIVLQGKKTKNKIVMTPLSEETVWDTYLNGVQASEGKMSKAYEYEVDGKVYSISRSYRTFVYSYEEEGKVVTESYPYIQTLEGVKMYSSMNLGGIEVHDLIFDGDTKSLKSRDGKVVLTKAVTPPAQLFVSNGPWFVTYEGLGTANQKNASAGCEAIKSVVGAYPMAFIIGSYIYTDNALNILAGQGYGALLLDTKVISNDEVSLTLTGSGDQFGVACWNGGGSKLFTTVAGMGAPMNWKVVPNDPDEPTVMTMTEVGNESNVIVVTNQETLFGYPAQ